MSYSFGVVAATKEVALAQANEKFDAVMLAQPVHVHDLPTARETVKEFLALLQDDPDRDVSMSVSGSVWATDLGLQQVMINVNAQLAARVQS